MEGNDHKKKPKEKLKETRQTVAELFEKVNPAKESNKFLAIVKFILTVLLYGLLILLSPIILLVLFIVAIVAV